MLPLQVLQTFIKLNAWLKTTQIGSSTDSQSWAAAVHFYAAATHKVSFCTQQKQAHKCIKATLASLFIWQRRHSVCVVATIQLQQSQTT